MLKLGMMKMEKSFENDSLFFLLSIVCVLGCCSRDCTVTEIAVLGLLSLNWLLKTLGKVYKKSSVMVDVAVHAFVHRQVLIVTCGHDSNRTFWTQQ